MTSVLRHACSCAAREMLSRIRQFSGGVEPESWAAADRRGDVIPQLALGILTTVVTGSLLAPARKGSAILRR